MAKAELQAAIEALGLSIESEFVPFSKSRNKGEKHRSLNWKVTLKCKGRTILTTDYGAGEAHCPSYEHFISVDVRTALDFETEHGRRCGANTARILPDPCDVVYSLVFDSDAIDHSTFEDWAGDLGFDPDSRKAEAIYRACLELGLKLRNGIGEDGLKLLREAAQDY